MHKNMLTLYETGSGWRGGIRRTSFPDRDAGRGSGREGRAPAADIKAKKKLDR